MCMRPACRCTQRRAKRAPLSGPSLPAGWSAVPAPGRTIGPVGATAARPVTSAAPTTRFYGWRVVAAAFTVLFVAYGLQFSFGVFVNEITDDTGWSRADILLPYAVYVALYSWLSSVSGWATDRYGPRRVVAIGAVILGIGWAGFGLAHALWQVYLTLGVVAAVGMSATWVPCNATVVRWFVRRRGTAVGVAVGRAGRPATSSSRRWRPGSSPWSAGGRRSR